VARPSQGGKIPVFENFSGLFAHFQRFNRIQTKILRKKARFLCVFASFFVRFWVNYRVF
jgi:hypothetical protein